MPIAGVGVGACTFLALVAAVALDAAVLSIVADTSGFDTVQEHKQTAAVAPAVFVGGATTDDVAVTAGIGAELAWAALSSTIVAVLIEVAVA